jgi:hypothetical protein
MESNRFDALSRSLATAGTRRRLLGFLASLPLAARLTGVEETPVAARGRQAGHHQTHKQRDRARDQHHKQRGQDAKSEACIPTGQRCPAKKPRGKKGKKLGCDDCCQGSFTTDETGAKICGCQPNGSACTEDTATSCCSGFCFGGTCQATTPCSAECSGCCDGSGTCQAGTTVAVCGKDGATCSACSGDTPLCKRGVCTGCTNQSQCPANTICTGSGACLTCDVCASGCPFTSVQAAIDARPDQRTFAICRGEYVGNLTLNRDVELIGARDGFTMLTTIRGDGTSSVIAIPDLGQNVTLSQMNVTGGLASSGGGILHEGRVLTLTDCVIVGNRATADGAGISAPAGSPARSVEMTRCSIDNNDGATAGARAGGLFNGASTTLRDCDVTFNSVNGTGGGIHNEGTLTLHTTRVGPQNAGAGGGGGIYNQGMLTLHASKVGPQNFGFGAGGSGILNNGGTVALTEGSIVCGNFPAGSQCVGFSDPGCQTTCPA